MNEDASHHEAGFTLIETLVALALISMVIAFSLYGLTSSLRIYDSVSRMQTASTRDTVTQHLRSLISSAFPAIFISQRDGLAKLFFDGQSQVLEFATISSGYALQGGAIRVRVGLDCDQTGNTSCRLMVGTAVHSSRDKEDGQWEKIAPLSGLSAIHFQYFGRKVPGGQAAWFETWSGLDHLPAALAIRCTFADQTVADIHLVVQLRNASFISD